MFLDKILLRLRGQTRENLGESSTNKIRTQIFIDIDESSL